MENQTALLCVMGKGIDSWVQVSEPKRQGYLLQTEIISTGIGMDK